MPETRKRWNRESTAASLPPLEVAHSLPRVVTAASEASTQSAAGQPPPNRERETRQVSRALLLLVSAAFFMQLLDSTILNAVIPTMATSLQAEPLQMRGALTCYVLALAVCTAISPWLCDRFGTRRVFGGAIVVFTLGSVLCGISQSLAQLIVSRILQGIGGAALLPVGRSVIARTAAKQELVGAMSTIMTVGIVGSILGPLLGGLMAEMASWRWVFFVNVPIGLTGLWLNAKAMPDYRRPATGPLDFLGFLIFAATCSSLLLASELGDVKSTDADRRLLWIGICLLSAIIFGIFYVMHVRKTFHPVVDLNMLRLTNVRVSLIGNLLTRLGVSGLLLIVVLWLQVGLGWSPLLAGFSMMPQAIGSIVGKRFIDRLLGKLGYRRFLILNTMMIGLILAAFALPGEDVMVTVMFIMMFIFGFFMGMQYVAMTTLAFVDLDGKHTGMVSSMAATTQYLAMGFGIALASTLMSLFLRDSSAGGYTRALHASVLVLALLTVLASSAFLSLDSKRTKGSSTVGERGGAENSNRSENGKAGA